jgi:cytochrome c biogenesis protein ResB
MLALIRARLMRFLRSLRLTAGVISGLIMIYFLGLVLPQKWMFETREQYDLWLDASLLNRLMDIIGFTDIYLSPVTIVLLALFFINLLVVIWARVPGIMRRAYIGSGPVRVDTEAIKADGGVLRAEVAAGRTDLEARLRGALRRGGYRVMPSEPEGTLLAVKNRYSPIGFLLFHLSFVLCLVGALGISYTRFSGKLTLTEGQSFDGDIAQFHRISDNPRLFKELPPLGLMLDEVRPHYERDVPSSLEAVLQVYDGADTRREVIDVNVPIKRGPLTIHASDIGVSPLVEILGPSGQVLDGAYFALNVLHGQSDSFVFESDPRFSFYVEFYPDYEVVDGLMRTRSIELRNPAFFLAVTKEGEQVFQGTVKPGEPAEFGNFALRFGGIRYWVEFIVVREYGVYPLVLGFILASAGLVMRLVFYQRRMTMVLEPQGDGHEVYLSGSSEYFTYSYKQELEAFLHDLQADIDGIEVSV